MPSDSHVADALTRRLATLLVLASTTVVAPFIGERALQINPDLEVLRRSLEILCLGTWCALLNAAAIFVGWSEPKFTRPLARWALASFVIGLTSTVLLSFEELTAIFVVGTAWSLAHVLLMQLLLAPLAERFKLRIRPVGSPPLPLQKRQWKFGLQRLLLFSAVASAAIGLMGRTIALHFSAESDIVYGVQELVANSCAALLGITPPLFSLALFAAALKRQRPVSAILLTIAVASLVGATGFGWALPLIRWSPEYYSPRTVASFTAVMSVSAVWTLILAWVLRVGGYRVQTGADDFDRRTKSALTIWNRPPFRRNGD